MKKSIQHIFMLISLLMIATMFWLCTTEDVDAPYDSLPLGSPNGQWVFDGYRSLESKTLERNVSPRAFALNLQSKGTFTGNTETNQISGTFEIKRNNISFSRENFVSTEFKETAAGELYLGRLLKVTNYKVFPEKLELYYSDSDFLQFSRLALQSR